MDHHWQHSVLRLHLLSEDQVKMKNDLAYDYYDALKRFDYKQEQVDLLRESVSKNVIIPKNLTDKQVND